MYVLSRYIAFRWKSSYIAFDEVDIDATSTSSVMRMDWSIQEVARLAGTTSRTLRHYDDVGLLLPSRVGSNGYRYYDGLTLARKR